MKSVVPHGLLAVRKIIFISLSALFVCMKLIPEVLHATPCHPRAHLMRETSLQCKPAPLTCSRFSGGQSVALWIISWYKVLKLKFLLIYYLLLPDGNVVNVSRAELSI